MLIPIVVPNTTVVLVTDDSNVERIGGTKERPLIFIKGIPRAFWPANSRTVPHAPLASRDVSSAAGTSALDSPDGSVREPDGD